MKNKELLKKLNTLKEIKAPEGKKLENRNILISQIYNGKENEVKDFDLKKFVLYLFPYELKNMASQPVLSVFVICFVVLSGLFTSVKFSQDTKPGDSLYIAKVLNEKRQKVLTFDEKEKVKLGIKLAENRMQEIDQILQDENKDKDNNENSEQVSQLVDDFKKEISDAKQNLEKIKKVSDNNLKVEDNKVAIIETKKEENLNNEQKKAEVEKESVFVARSDKDNQTMEIYEAKQSTYKILNEAKSLLDNNDYEATINKLVEVDKAILITKDNEENVSTTTNEVINEKNKATSSVEDITD